MDQNIDVVDLISTLLDEGKYKEALSVPIEEKYVNNFKDNCWDLISVIISKIQNDTLVIKPSLYGACEELLAIIAQIALPEEALLEFIEQIEVSKNDAQFCVILQPLQQLLLKLTSKRGMSLEWCLNSISTYIDGIPIPNYQLDGKERLLLESNDNIRRIAKIYSLLPPFYSPFIKEVTSTEPNNKTKEILAAFLISLLGKPLIYVDVDPHTNSMSESRKCTAVIINDIALLVKNFLKLFAYVDKSFKENQKAKSDNRALYNENEVAPFDQKEKINLTTLSGLYYGIYSGHFEIPDFTIPLVYSAEYVVHTILHCVVHLLSFVEYGPLSKGVSLCSRIIKLIPNNSSHSLLSMQIHFSLCNHLMNVSIYGTFESIRKESVSLLGSHINKFEYKGRCMLIKFLFENANHSGMIGYAITLFKNSINEAFNDPELPSCFIDEQLIGMLKKICYLPHGASSDLVELADQIITSLNFLRYLAIRDSTNRTGFKDYYPTLESEYIDQLRTGLNMSKAHYEEKLKEIEESKKVAAEKENVSITVGGNVLDQIPTENKRYIIHSALNAFHLIEGLLARLIECINSTKSMIY